MKYLIDVISDDGSITKVVYMIDTTLLVKYLGPDHTYHIRVSEEMLHTIHTIFQSVQPIK
jgi:hypothetical protein